MGNVFVAVFLKNQHILDANTEFSGQIDTRLGRCDHIFFHYGLAGGAYARGFVNLHTKAVAVAVAEELSLTGIGNLLTG